MNAYESVVLVLIRSNLVIVEVLGGMHTFWAPPSSDSQADPRGCFKHKHHCCCTQNVLWTCHKISEVLGGMHPFGHLPVQILRQTLNIPSNTHLIAASHKMSSGHVINMTMNAYESVGLVPFISYLVRSDVLGGMHSCAHLPLQTPRLTLNIPSNTHPIAAEHKISSGHDIWRGCKIT